LARLWKRRARKLIGNALEAAVVLTRRARGRILAPRGTRRIFYFKRPDPEARTRTFRYHYPDAPQKVRRCWRHRPTVGTIATHPELCDRRAAVGKK
jgi:hypothetical protein